MTTPFDNLLKEKLPSLPNLVSKMETLSSICEYLGYSSNGRYTKALGLFLKANSIDYSHFRTSKSHPKNMVECICPQCGKSFTKNMNHGKESTKVTCSHACGNKYFSQKQQFGRHLGEGFNTLVKYNEKLTKYLPTIGLLKECLVCKETIVECHHVDEDHNNDDINNLVFLCPTHHVALHKYKSESVFNAVIEHLDYRDTLENTDLNQ